ncbi:hypothetical protein AB0K09_01960 [Streptomyces sp. NPDC049577]|uniref:hypothetical protein n=1 Tax=Streptomyces sp. NPDC049577 TaxID=3155153 RepID=UPI00342058C1
MAITTQDIRKAATDTAYATAGAADLTAEKIGQLVAEAPGIIERVRTTDPKALGERVTQQAKEAQDRLTAQFNKIAGNLDTDAKKLGQTVQDLALQGVGQAVGAAAKAGETFDKLAERGREAVKTWRGEAAEEITEIAVAVEPGSEAEKKDEPAAEAKDADAKPAAARKPAARKPAAARKTDGTGTTGTKADDQA